MELLFFVGAAGSLVVVIWTAVEDLSLFSRSKEAPDDYLTTGPDANVQPHAEPDAGS